jgi:hypothetical protein
MVCLRSLMNRQLTCSIVRRGCRLSHSLKVGNVIEPSYFDTRDDNKGFYVFKKPASSREFLRTEGWFFKNYRVDNSEGEGYPPDLERGEWLHNEWKDVRSEIICS